MMVMDDEIIEYLGWWKEAKWSEYGYETPNGIPQSVQFLLFLAVEIIGGVILFRKNFLRTS